MTGHADLIARLEEFSMWLERWNPSYAMLIDKAIAALTAQATRRCNKCGHVIAATYGNKGCQLPICAGDREDAARRR